MVRRIFLAVSIGALMAAMSMGVALGLPLLLRRAAPTSSRRIGAHTFTCNETTQGTQTNEVGQTGRTSTVTYEQTTPTSQKGQGKNPNSTTTTSDPEITGCYNNTLNRRAVLTNPNCTL
jgi:hypothetical protein